MADRQPVTLLGLERALQGDGGEALRDRLLSELEAYSARVRRELFAGAPPERYRELEHLRDALERARRLIPAAWKRYHLESER